MRGTIDIRNVLIGALAAILVTCALGAVGDDSDCLTGRYALGTNPGCAFVLDTMTGQVWGIVTSQEGTYAAPPHTPEEFYESKPAW